MAGKRASSSQAPPQYETSWFSSMFGQCCKGPPTEGELKFDEADHNKKTRKSKGVKEETSRGISQTGGNSTSGRFKVDNSILQIENRPGVAYRYSKRDTDKVRNELGPAKWGEIVEGTDEGDGWLKVGQYYLPMAYQGIPVVTPVVESGSPQKPKENEPPARSPATPLTSPTRKQQSPGDSAQRAEQNRVSVTPKADAVQKAEQNVVGVTPKAHVTPKAGVTLEADVVRKAEPSKVGVTGNMDVQRQEPSKKSESVADNPGNASAVPARPQTTVEKKFEAAPVLQPEPNFPQPFASGDGSPAKDSSTASQKEEPKLPEADKPEVSEVAAPEVEKQEVEEEEPKFQSAPIEVVGEKEPKFQDGDLLAVVADDASKPSKVVECEVDCGITKVDIESVAEKCSVIEDVKQEQEQIAWFYRPSVGTWLQPAPANRVQDDVMQELEVVVPKVEVAVHAPVLLWYHKPSVGTWLSPLPIKIRA